jgi:hypothetical protein
MIPGLPGGGARRFVSANIAAIAIFADTDLCDALVPGFKSEERRD